MRGDRRVTHAEPFGGSNGSVPFLTAAKRSVRGLREELKGFQGAVAGRSCKGEVWRFEGSENTGGVISSETLLSEF